jgi:eukaryotic-like serine/threonine-protein kinase
VSLTPGTRLGPYEIGSLLGAGGMGQVYRARDPRLDRGVAIKVLAPDLANDLKALARFEREAMTVARLSHPNILAIYEFGRDGPQAFVVMELINGENLRFRLARGPIRVQRAVGYALQIAQALAAAHARGIVHRDLKPENVMVTRDDHVKILDFGLAKPVEIGPAPATQGLTHAGAILGTVGYMAPEQIRGQAIDHRCDIFACGAVLYEMLSGVRAFGGDTPADTMTAVLTREPADLDMARLSIPPTLERIVNRCLEKDPARRFQSANDLAFALEMFPAGPRDSNASVTVTAPRTRSRVSLRAVIVAGALAAGIAAGWIARDRIVAGEPRWQQFTRITEAAGEETSPTISPDGANVAYAMKVNGSWDIYAQRVGGRNATPIVADAQRDEGGPAYSPDGTRIAFHQSDANGGIFVAGATGESVRRVSDFGFHPAWSPDGSRIAFTTEEIVDPASRQGESALYVVDAAGGIPRRIVDGDAAQPSWSPSGSRIAYWSNLRGQRDLYTVAASGGPPVPILADAPLDWSPVWSPDGRFVYFSSSRGGTMNLWRIAVDEASGRAKGQPEPVTSGVEAAAAYPRFSKDGSRLVFRSRVAYVNPVALPLDGAGTHLGTPVVLDGSNHVRLPIDVSPDGTLLSYSNSGEPQEDLFLSALDGSRMRRLTDDGARDRGPTFTKDGRVVFYAHRDGQWALWSVRLDGSDLHKLLAAPDGTIYPVLAPARDRLVFTSAGGTRTVFITTLGAQSAGQPEALPNTRIGTTGLTATGWSPDGSKIVGAMMSDAGRPVGIGVYDLAARTVHQVSNDRSYAARWLCDSRRVVYFVDDGQRLAMLDTDTGGRTVFEQRLPGGITDDMFAISPDCRTVYYGRLRAEADIWIAERKVDR